MESPSRVLLGSQSEEFGWFPSVSTNSTPIWVDTREVGHIHVLLPTLEYSVPVGSPAVPGLTRAPGRPLPVQPRGATASCSSLSLASCLFFFLELISLEETSLHILFIAEMI